VAIGGKQTQKQQHLNAAGKRDKTNAGHTTTDSSVERVMAAGERRRSIRVIVSKSPKKQQAENSPGRAAPGFVATPATSPQHAAEARAARVEPKGKESEKNNKNDDVEGEIGSANNSGDASSSARVGKDDDSTRDANGGSQKALFQKPSYDAFLNDPAADDLPCEVLSSTRTVRDDATTTATTATTATAHKFDFLRKGQSSLISRNNKKNSLPPLQAAGAVGSSTKRRSSNRQKLAPLKLKFDRKKHGEFRQGLEELKKGRSSVKRLERFMMKKLKLPRNAVDLILVLGEVKASSGATIVVVSNNDAQNAKNANANQSSNKKGIAIVGTAGSS
jgi:hypothetical protein